MLRRLLSRAISLIRVQNQRPHGSPAAAWGYHETPWGTCPRVSMVMGSYFGVCSLIHIDLDDGTSVEITAHHWSFDRARIAAAIGMEIAEDQSVDPCLLAVGLGVTGPWEAWLRWKVPQGVGSLKIASGCDAEVFRHPLSDGDIESIKARTLLRAVS